MTEPGQLIPSIDSYIQLLDFTTLCREFLGNLKYCIAPRAFTNAIGYRG